MAENTGSVVDNLLTFKWAENYRTYALCLLIFISAIYKYVSGEVSIATFIDHFAELALGPTGMAIRAGIAGLKK